MSPYKDKEKRTQAVRDYRGRQKGLQKEGITESRYPKDASSPAILRAITDPKKRSKLERISQGLSDRGLGKDVRYGIGGPTFDIVKELLEVTR